MLALHSTSGTFLSVCAPTSCFVLYYSLAKTTPWTHLVAADYYHRLLGMPSAALLLLERARAAAAAAAAAAAVLVVL